MDQDESFWTTMAIMNAGKSSSSSSSSSNNNNGRHLENNDNHNDNHQTYLADNEGTAYEPYSLAWRLLGMYIDCDVEEQQNDNDKNNGGNDGNDVHRERRQLKRQENPYNDRRSLASGDTDDGGCSRKLLWAAYHDPGYKDASIGEYQYYDWRTDTWDKSTCQTQRCARMDCHVKNTHFQLVGIFKETDGIVDWAEQLIKHEGYCVWNDVEYQQELNDENGEESDQNSHASADGNSNSAFNFMYKKQDYWSSECTKMYLTDSYGNTLYRDIAPLPGGNMTDRLYLDEDCTQKAAMSFREYIIKYYSYYYYDEEKGEQVASNWLANNALWNELMNDFKVCQPCRAYSKFPNLYDRRSLNDNGQQDGEGDSEQFGYNCYDNAGYRNCNQCYKFEVRGETEKDEY
jgi:hypothetical protein